MTFKKIYHDFFSIEDVEDMKEMLNMIKDLKTFSWKMENFNNN